MYLVAQQYTDQQEKVNLMGERFHETLDAALADYTDRSMRGHRDLCIAKLLTVKTIVIDPSDTNGTEYPLVDRVNIATPA